MGNGFMSRPSSADSVWGKVEETKDEELYQPIRNYYGEVVGWRERTESEKLKRREINAEFAMIESEEDEVEDDQSEKSPSPTPTPPPPPPKKPLKVVIQESSDIEEEENPFNKSSDRTPSAKSVMVSPAAAPHSSRVKDKFRPSLLPAENFNKDSAAGRLYKALHGETRTDVAAVIEILTQHSAEQRKKICKSYKFNHNKVGAGNLLIRQGHNNSSSSERIKLDLSILYVNTFLSDSEERAGAQVEGRHQAAAGGTGPGRGRVLC